MSDFVIDRGISAYTVLQRVEPIGWDADDRTYYVLDDNRVYRVSEAPEAPVRKARKQKTYGSSRRSSKRRQTREIEIAEDVALTETPGLDQESAKKSSMGGGMLWECVAVTLDDVRVLVEGFRKTRDANEKVLREQLCTHLLPILERQDESRKRKEVQRERELLSLAKMANAKRSSRIAGKAEQQREEEKAREERETLRKEQEAQRREEQKRAKLERERDFRMFSREKRLKERGARRQLHEEELAQLSEGRHSTPDGPTRISDRQLQSEIDRNKQALKELEEEEEEWIFDCVCGLYGQVDDGAHSIACERCNVWQHSKCVGIKESEADRADFHFLCGSCKRRLESDTPRKTVIKLKVKGSNDLIPLQPDLNRDSVLSSIKPENSEAVAAANEENETRSAKAALGNGLATPEIRINSSQSNLSLNSGVSQPRNASLTSASNTTNALGKVGSAEESSLMDSELSHSTNSAQIPIQQAGVPGAVEPEGVKLGPVGRKSMHPAQPSATASPIEAHQPGSMDGAQKMPLAQGPPRLHDRSNLDSSATGYSIGHAELQTTPTASQTVSTARALDVVDQQGVKNAVTPAQGNIITLNESGKALATTETPNSMQESTSGRALAPHQNGSNDH